MSWSVQDWPRFSSGTKGNPEHPASVASKPYRPWAVDFFEISLFDILSFRFFSVPLQAVFKPGCDSCAGFRLCLRGGNANNGGQCGLSTLNVNNAVSDSNVNYGAALNLTRYCRLVCLAAVISGVRPCLMAKHTL